MNTGINNVKATKDGDLYNIISSGNKTSNIHENTEDEGVNDKNSKNDTKNIHEKSGGKVSDEIIPNCYTLTKESVKDYTLTDKYHKDKSNESEINLDLKIDDKGGTNKNSKDNCNLDSNSNLKKIEETEYDIVIIKSKIHSEVYNTSSQQNIDLENENISNKSSTTSTKSHEKKSFFSEKNQERLLDENSRFSLVNDDGNKQGKSTENLTECAQDTEERGIKIISTATVKSKELIDNHVSHNIEQLNTCIDEYQINNTNITGSQANILSDDNSMSEQKENAKTIEESNTNFTGSQANRLSGDSIMAKLRENTKAIEEINTNMTGSQPTVLSADKSISEQEKNYKTIKENNTNITGSQANRLSTDNSNLDQNTSTIIIEENLTQNHDDYEFNIPRVFVQENPRRKSIDNKYKIIKLENLPEDSDLIDNKENQSYLLSIKEMKRETIEVVPDIPTMDQQKQQQQQLPDGWKRETVLRSRKNKIDVYYISPNGLRLRSEAELYQHCETERLNLDLSLFDFGYDEVDLTDSDTTITLSDDDSDGEEIVWASTGSSSNKKACEEPSAKANILHSFDIVNSQISKRIYLGRDIVLTPKVIPYEITVNAKQRLPEFLKGYTVLCQEEYLAFRTKEQFWQEPFMKRIYQAIEDQEITIAEASELLGVKYFRLNHEYNEFTKNPWLTETFTEYLREKDRASAKNQVESHLRNSQLEPIRATTPSQIIPSTSMEASAAEGEPCVSVTKTIVPPSLYPTTDLDRGIRKKKCHCKRSQCLNQSCECFDKFERCRNCTCINCHNKDEDPKREAAMKKRLRKMYPSLSKDLKTSNAAAMAAARAVDEMMSKPQQSMVKSLDKDETLNATTTVTGMQTSYIRHGCKCSKTACHKNFCGCYSMGLNCSDACLCVNCANRITMHSIFDDALDTSHDIPSNPESSSSSPQRMDENVTDTIERIFQQVDPKPIPNINKIKELQDKETFLHKWLEANYQIAPNSTSEENLLMLHLKNTQDRLNLEHTITISQLRKAVSKVFGTAVYIRKRLESQYCQWVYIGMKSVLAYPVSNSITPPTSPDFEPPITPTTVSSTVKKIVSLPEKGDDVDKDLTDKDFDTIYLEEDKDSNSLISTVVEEDEDDVIVLSDTEEENDDSDLIVLSDSEEELNNIPNEDGTIFCPLIEDVYSEPKVLQTSISGPNIPWRYSVPAGLVDANETLESTNIPPVAVPAGLLDTTGPHGDAHVSRVVNPPDYGLSLNSVQSNAKLLSNPAESTVARAVETGIRVQRGPDWTVGDEDGHGIGTVTELSKKGMVRVVWDCNKSSEGTWYSMGRNGKYLLQPADEAPRVTPAQKVIPSVLPAQPPTAPILINSTSTSQGQTSATLSLAKPSSSIVGTPSGLMLSKPHDPLPGPVLMNTSGPVLVKTINAPGGMVNSSAQPQYLLIVPLKKTQQL
ncbi:unnamed protein product [Meganyctiphanes norvegica]|uniref:Uncharacterized protein n=1 Tax=Meganyctiphanes norvegica TaxID=48144 RepID=A0AAV2PWC4_MEGNR